MILRVARLDTPLGAIDLAVSGRGLCDLSFEGDRDALKSERAERAAGTGVKPAAVGADASSFAESGWVRALRLRLGSIELREESDPDGVVTRMRAYFAGDIAAVDAIAVDPGGTPFQALVWTALRSIPAGQTSTYGELARAIGRPAAIRAVGAANGANPVAIVIPCHRVIGADGSLVGYGGGMDRKRALLEHEGVRTPTLFSPPPRQDREASSSSRR